MQLADKKEIAIISSTKTRQDRAVNRIDTNQPTDHEVTVKEQKSATPDILDEYKSYKELFCNNKTATALPQHKP
jgi:hypothetical protein